MFAQKTGIVYRAGGCWGCLFVSMELTGVDNCSNDCGGSRGGTVSGSKRRQC